MTLFFMLGCTFVLDDQPCSPDTGGTDTNTGIDSADTALDSAPDTAEDSGCETSALFRDVDGDGFGDPELSEDRCPTEGWVAEAGDCNDADADVHPGARERCNGTSDACDAAWANDDGLATFTDALGAIDLTAELAGIDGAPAFAAFGVGSLALCTGTWFVNLSFTAGGVVSGVGDGVVLDGGGAGSVLDLGAGDYDLSGLTVRNGAGSAGGGISVNGADNLSITGLVVEANTAAIGGGLSMGTPTVATIVDSTFSGNAATGDGGGVAVSGGSLLLRSSTVSANHATGQGGGIYAEDAALTCIGDGAVEGLGVLENASDAKENEVRLAGRSFTLLAESCDLARTASSPLGIVSVEAVSDFAYGPDATFSCDSTGCVGP
ncbi:hypothetical protein LBMAG42_22000 [Deltaproteobacteria bacterium]|nr:hypothetical protein LBMAG42_22000 [Deltaproteobacteria bacterium]